MKKIISITLAIAMLVTVLAMTGCSSSGADLSKVMDTVNSKFSSETKNLTKLKDTSELNKYYQIKEDEVKQFAAEYDPNDAKGASTEIVLVEAKDSNAVKNIQSALETRYNYVYSQASSYDAEHAASVKDCKVVTDNNYVMLVISDNYDDIVKEVKSEIG